MSAPRVWFTSDLHFGHERVAQIRGFTTATQHDAAVIENYLAAVHEQDTVWILGDLAATSPYYALDTIAQLPGHKHLILGNHDRAHSMHRDAHKWQRQYLDVFESVQIAARRRVNGQNVLLSHFPYERDRDEKRYAQWRLPDEGLPLLHGHTHGKERLSLSTVHSSWDSPHERVEIHVGLDAWGLKPVPLETIADLLNKAVS